MDAPQYHLCHLNVGPARGPLHSPVMAEFVANLERINQLAYDSPGFVWHLIIDINNPDDLAMYGVPGLLFNLSVWESPEALHNYVYKSMHATFLKSRRQWFGEMEGPSYVLWWVPAGHIPTLDEAKAKLAYLGEHGASPDAFTFRDIFPAPNQTDTPMDADNVLSRRTRGPARPHVSP